MRIFASLAIALCLAGCGDDNNTTDLGGTKDLSVAGDAAGRDMVCDNSMPASSLCGHVCDKGNSKSVGKYCDNNTPCPSGTICSTIASTTTFFCTIPCTPDGNGMDTAKCGENTVCMCDAQAGGCGCTPAACVMPQG